MHHAPEILVVGGGPAGSATALRLARAGRDVTLIDRARFPRHKACSEYGSPATVAELCALGLGPALSRTTWTRLGGTSVTAVRGSRLRGRFADVAGTPADGTGLALPRHELDALLLDAARAAGVTVLEATRLRDVAARGDRHEATVEQGGRETTILARAIVGADGLNGKVSRIAGLRRHGGLRRVGLVAHLRGVAGLRDEAELHVGRRGYLGLNPLGDGIANVAFVMPAARAAEMRGSPRERLAAALADFPTVAARIPLTPDARVSAIGPFDATCRRSTAPGTLLVGDAAEFFDPFTGEGIATALIGARLAAPVLDAALATPGAITPHMLAPYRRARVGAFAGKWIVERLIGYAMLQPTLFDRMVRRIAARGLAATLLGVTGHVLPARRVLNPVFMVRAVL
jgi:geranylgeranyl reductase family protein